jgi:hypothetical protein
MSEERSFYVYGLWAPGAFEPAQIRYVGKGSGNRAFDSKRRSKRVKNWIAQVGEPLFDILYANLTAAEAFALEIETIAKHGREGIDPGGVLLNISLGGAGPNGMKLSDGHRAIALVNLTKGRSPEAAAARSTAMKGRKLSDEHRAKVSAAKRGTKQSPEHRANIGSALRGKAISDAHRAAISAAQKVRWTARKAISA